MSFSSTKLPKPDRWIDFEANVCELFKLVLDDPNTQLNGRSGQSQNGVDVVGRREKKYWVGIQCKHKKNDTDVTETELRAEVENAQGFRPKLSEFILITNSPRDAKIQQVARVVTDELSNSESGFSVAVWGWDDVCEQVNKYPAVRKYFEPEYTPQFDEVKSDLQRLTASNEFMCVQISTLRDGKDTAFIGKVKAYSEINDHGDSNNALQKLLNLKRESWGTVKSFEKYRLLLALSNCYITTGDFTTAGDLIKQAYSDYPDHIENQSNLALAHFLHGENDRAMEIASEEIVESSENVHAAIILIQVRIKLHYENELDNIAEELLNDQSVIAARLTGLRERGDYSWMELALSTYKTFDKKIDDSSLKLLCAEAMIEFILAVRKNENELHGADSHTSESDLEYAVEVTSSMAKAAIGNKSYKAPYLVHNAVIALQLNSNNSDARSLVSSARTVYPNDVDLRALAVELAHKCDDYPEVLRLTDNDQLNNSETLVRAMVLLNLARIGEVVECLENIEWASAPIHTHMQVLDLKAQLALRETKLYSSDEFYADIKKSESHVTQKLALRSLEARYRRLIGQNESAREIIESAASEINSESHWLDRKCVAMEALHHGLYDHVVESMADHVSLERDSDDLRIFLEAVFQSGDEFGVGKHLDALPESLKNSRYFHRMKVTLASDTGDPSALDELSNYISKYPNDTSVLLVLFRRYQLSESVHSCVDLTNSISLNSQDGSVHERMALFTHTSKYGKFEESVEAAHQLLMNSWDNPEIHKMFTLMILMPAQDLAEILPNCSVVGVGTAIEVSLNGVIYKYRFEIDETHSLFLDERLTSDSDLFDYLIGKACKQEIEIGCGVNKKIYKIENIKPLYIDSLHRSIAEIEARFPNYNEVSVMSVNPDRVDGFNAITEILKSQHNANKKTVEVYRNHNIPVSILAARRGIDVLDLYELLRHEKTPYVNSMGTVRERIESLRTIHKNSKNGCVVDVSAIEVINILGIGELVKRECGPIYLSQAVLDYFASRLIRLKEFAMNGSGSVQLNNGMPLVVDSDVQALEDSIQRIESNLDWMREHCQVKAVTRDPSFPKELSKFELELRAPIFDSALIAKSESVLLLSDDYYLRTLVSKTLLAHGCWIQLVLEVSLRKGNLTQDDYLEKMVLLAATGASFLPINSAMLNRKAELDGHTISVEICLLLSYLGAKDALIDISIDVVTDFLSNLLKTGVPLPNILRYLSEILLVLCSNRWESRYGVVLNLVQDLSKNTYLPVEPIAAHAETWLIGHSMGFKK